MDLLCHLIDAKKKSRRHWLCNTALEKMGLFSFLGVQLLSLPLMALQFHWSSIRVRGTVQFYQCARHSPVLSVCGSKSSSTCSTQPDRHSLQLQLHCGYQFPRCARTLTHQRSLSTIYDIVSLPHFKCLIGWYRYLVLKKSCPILKLKYVYFHFKIGEIWAVTVGKMNYG